ncbi:MAG: type II secretion system F family protein [Synergistaceae bacterium]|nr:type II secretion system F family protein [Synergistaceae bacterium]
MLFKYRARSSSGEIVENAIEAQDQQSAIQVLKSTGMLVINLTAQGKAKTKTSGGGLFGALKSKPKENKTPTPQPRISQKKTKQPLTFKSLLSMDLAQLFNTGRVPLKNLMVFFRQLATMESAGLSLATSLDMIAGGEKNYALKTALIDIKARLDRGIPLSQAMSAQRAFNPLLIALVEAGEEGGLLGQALEQGAMMLEKQEQLRGKIRSAMFYPAFVMFFAVAILVFFFIFLVPKFQDTFDSLGIELPGITVFLFGMGDWFQAHWYLIALGVVLMIGGWIFLSHNPATKGAMDRFKLKIPVIKGLILKAAMARSSRTLSSLTAAGVPIVRSLEMAEGTANNVPVQKGYEDLRKGIIRGMSLGDASKMAGIFPILVSQMMRIGEETGHLDQMLESGCVRALLSPLHGLSPYQSICNDP